MSRDYRLYLEDMLVCCDRITAHAHEMTLEDFEANQLVQDAAIHNLHIIGEAANHIPEAVRAQYADVPWGAMIDLRNRIAHGYYDLVQRTVWDTITIGVPVLRAKVELMLSETTTNNGES